MDCPSHYRKKLELFVEPLIFDANSHATCNATLISGRLDSAQVLLLSSAKHGESLVNCLNIWKQENTDLIELQNLNLGFVSPRLKTISYYAFALFLSYRRNHSKIFYLSCDYLLFPLIQLAANLFHGGHVDIVIHKPVKISKSKLRRGIWSSYLRANKKASLIAINEKSYYQLKDIFPRLNNRIKLYYPFSDWRNALNAPAPKDSFAFLPPKLYEKISQKIALGQSYFRNFRVVSQKLEYYDGETGWMKCFTMPSGYLLDTRAYLELFLSASHLIIDVADEGDSFSGYRLDALSCDHKIIEINTEEGN